MKCINFKSLGINYLWHFFIAAIHLKVLINFNFMLVPITCENNEINTHSKRTFSDRIRPFVLFSLKKPVFHLFALQSWKKKKDAKYAYRYYLD